MTTVCVSIDVDSIDCYYRIHSLGESPESLRDRILCSALPRFSALFDELGIKATFFVVASDLETSDGADAACAQGMRDVVRDLARDGHEIASHSYGHRYEMARLPAQLVKDDIDRAHEILSELRGKPVVGFRSPGYDLSPEMLGVLLDKAYLYDSSVFPAPGYYAAKALVMAGLRMAGRKSGAVMTNPRALAAPIAPYRPRREAPWARGSAPIWELPVAVTRPFRTPVIGTNVVLAPQWLRRHWLKAMRGRSFFNFELHAIDLCDSHDDEMPSELVRRQPDLRVPLGTKRARLRQLLTELRDSGASYATLEDFALSL